MCDNPDQPNRQTTASEELTMPHRDPQYHRNPHPPMNRREMLHRMGAGFGSLGLADMLAAEPVRGATSVSPLASKAPHFAPKAKHVIQLFMPGGPSQVDTFDHKPEIEKHAGERPSIVNRKTLRNTKTVCFHRRSPSGNMVNLGNGSVAYFRTSRNTSTTSVSSTRCTPISRNMPVRR